MIELRCLSPASGNLGAAVVARLPLLGAHQADNAALAAAAALALEIPPTIIAEGLGRVSTGKHRGQLLTIGGRHILDDCYNANPASTVAALKTLAGLRGSAAAVAVLGDMLELGPTEDELHRQVGSAAASSSLSQLIAVGRRARLIADAASQHGLPSLAVDSAEAAASAVVQATAPGDWILLKGSRGMVLEHVLDHLRAQLEGVAPATAH
jgi:UDP-N-acetylmuramyl pentapeptide synthase